jgi:hypothetical protein
VLGFVGSVRQSRLLVEGREKVCVVVDLCGDFVSLFWLPVVIFGILVSHIYQADGAPKTSVCLKARPYRC